MRLVIQRVREAAVHIAGRESGRIGCGLVVLIGCEPTDTAADIEWLVSKLISLKLFDNEAGEMDRSVTDAGGGILLVSQFTLFASTRKGTRPSWHRAAKPDLARPLYEQFRQQLELSLGRPVATGEFGADMQVSLVNDGPVTILIDTKNKE